MASSPVIGSACQCGHPHFRRLPADKFIDRTGSEIIASLAGLAALRGTTVIVATCDVVLATGRRGG
jgi:hypothetical protein